MQIALEEAHKALLQQEVPIGAVLVLGHTSLLTGFNKSIHKNSSLAHAELEVIEKAHDLVQNYRLPQDSCLYVTCEPCMMCLGAILHARIGRLVYAAANPKYGALQHSRYQDWFPGAKNLEVRKSVLQDQAQALLQQFFKAKRRAKETDE